MKYERFKQLWDALVTQRIHANDSKLDKLASGVAISNGMNDHTMQSLIEFGMEGKGPFVDVRARIKAAKAEAAKIAAA